MSRSSFQLKLNTKKITKNIWTEKKKSQFFMLKHNHKKKKIPLQVNTFYKQIHHTIIIQPYSVSFKSHSWDQEKKIKMGKKNHWKNSKSSKTNPVWKGVFFFILLLKSRFMVLTTDAYKKQLLCELYTYSQFKVNYL